MNNTLLEQERTLLRDLKKFAALRIAANLDVQGRAHREQKAIEETFRREQNRLANKREAHRQLLLEESARAEQDTALESTRALDSLENRLRDSVASLNNQRAQISALDAERHHLIERCICWQLWIPRTAVPSPQNRLHLEIDNDLKNAENALRSLRASLVLKLLRPLHFAIFMAVLWGTLAFPAYGLISAGGLVLSILFAAGLAFLGRYLRPAINRQVPDAHPIAIYIVLFGVMWLLVIYPSIVICRQNAWYLFNTVAVGFIAVWLIYSLRKWLPRINGDIIESLTWAEKNATVAAEEIENRHRYEKARLVDENQRRLAHIRLENCLRIDDHDQQSRRLYEDAHAACQLRLRDHAATVETELASLMQEWDGRRSDIERRYADLRETIDVLFPPWNSPNLMNSQRRIPPAISFGTLDVRGLGRPEGAIQDRVPKGLFPEIDDLPALLPFDTGSILFKTTGDGLPRVQTVVQAILLRLLHVMPGGTLRFLFIDPVQLGRGFAGFMHLADSDKDLITGQVWITAHHIERQLSDLTEHLAAVVQKYLRNTYASIEDYNAEAGKVAEPYRVVVVSNFPAAFNEETAGRLVSLARTGRSCGVFTIIIMDTSKELPHNISLAELESISVNFFDDGKTVRWSDPDFGELELRPETLPSSDRFTAIVELAGQAAKEESRVEVSFDTIAPESGREWTCSSKKELAVPLGIAGAQRRQMLRLGVGITHHGLIAGQTGSGKSSLLHTLILNLALHYSPFELELYLIDFKEGVEFEPYARHQLAHARVIALQSEREFALSVLRRLQSELQERAGRFRRASVDGIAEFREQLPNEPCPRIVLIIDEFQLFFSEDDAIGREAAQLLDDLARRGRSFGIHILLASQTLRNNQMLSSTSQQLALRIALQCTDSESRLILSDDNPVARTLSRQGEAIYNDSNGAVEGNNRFQVAYINKKRKEETLSRLRGLTSSHSFRMAPTIVFRGNVPADVSQNSLLSAMLSAPTCPRRCQFPQLWLGDSLSLERTIAVPLVQRRGANLLVLGSDQDECQGVLFAAILSLVAHLAADSLDELIWIDFSPREDPFTQIVDMLPDLIRRRLIRIIRKDDLKDVLSKLREELERRRRDEQVHHGLYVIFNGLHRNRDLRLKDSFSAFTMTETAEPDLSKLFLELLEDGSAVGIHLLAWCDSLSNLFRVIDRNKLDAFDLRIAFAMSPTDSHNAVEFDAAARVGKHRAVLYRQDLQSAEKFRPYGLPSMEWLDIVRTWIRAKSEIGNADENASATSEVGLTMEKPNEPLPPTP